MVPDSVLHAALNPEVHQARFGEIETSGDD